jgi:hypothetical protein
VGRVVGAQDGDLTTCGVPSAVVTEGVGQRVANMSACTVQLALSSV